MGHQFPNNLPFLIRLYSFIKLQISPLARLNDLTPLSGHVLDVGCGYGLGSWIIGYNKPNLCVEGIDIDPEKIGEAKKYFSSEKLQYKVKDINKIDTVKKYDAVVVSDIFYLIPYKKQEEFISRITSLLKKDGKFILKEMDIQPRWKYYFNLIQETIVVRVVGFTWGNKFFFRSTDSYKKLFEKYGLRCETLEV